MSEVLFLFISGGGGKVVEDATEDDSLGLVFAEDEEVTFLDKTLESRDGNGRGGGGVPESDDICYISLLDTSYCSSLEQKQGSFALLDFLCLIKGTGSSSFVSLF